MRHLLAFLLLVVAMLVFASAAPAKNEKFTFADVTYPDGTTGEIEAAVKTTNKTEQTACTYFTDDYRAALGYYLERAETASTDPDEVLAFCLEHFDERFA